MTLPDAPMKEEIQRLEELRLKNPRGHTFARLADLYRKSGQPLQGLEVVESGLEHHPHYLNAHLVHGRILRDLGRRKEAADAFRRVLEIDEENLVAIQAIEDINRPRPLSDVSPPSSHPELGVVRVESEEAVEVPPASVSSWLAQLDAEWQEAREPTANGDRAESPKADPGGVADDQAEGELGSAETGGVESTEAVESDTGEAGGAEAVESAAAESAETAGREPDEVGRAEPEPAQADLVEDAGPHLPDSGDEGKAEDDHTLAMATATLAELYCQQGLYEEAISVYEKLLARDPYNAGLAARLDETRRLSHQGPRRRAGPVPTGPAEAADSVRPSHPGQSPDSGHSPDSDLAADSSRSSDSSPAAADSTRPIDHPGEAVEPPGTLTIREQLTSILEGRAEPNPNPKPGAVARLRHWLADAARSESD